MTRRRMILILTMLVLTGLFVLTVIIWRHSVLGRTEIADCGWDGQAMVWLDKNGNGVRDQGEQPFQSVKVFVDDTLNHYTKVGRNSVSDFRGVASLSVWLPGCPSVEFEVYVEPPAGYRLTTKPRLPAQGKTAFEFGLIKSE